MAKVKIEKLIDFVTTENVKAFVLSTSDGSNQQLNTSIYYGNVEKSVDRNDLNYNKGCLFTDDKIYQGLYSAKDFFYKSVGYKHNTFDHKLLNDNISNVIQVNNFIYALKDPTNRGVSILSNDIYTILSANDGVSAIDESVISTYLFNANNISSILDNKLPDNIGSYVLDNPNINLKYNQLLETPGHTIVDYDSGYFPANIFKCKNNYNNLYNETYINNNQAREYISIDKCNNQIYLKYKNKGEDIENVETIVGLNRYETLNLHKTNMYNINIACEKIFNNSHLNNSNDYQQILELFKQEIKNCVIEICKKITPVDTQLINVNVYNRKVDFN